MYFLELVGEDDAFARCEAATQAPDVRVVAPGIALSSTRPERPMALAYTRRISQLVDRTPVAVPAAVGAVTDASVDRSGRIAVRASGIRGTSIDSKTLERELGSVLVDRGFTVDLDDPDHVLRVVCSNSMCLIGWLIAEPDRDFANREPTDRPFFQPGSMDPRLARALVNIAGGRHGVRILDPMCGTGGVVIEAGLVGAMAIGTDVQARMVDGTAMNCRRYCPDANVTVLQADAARLPIADDTIDAVVFDAPYGRQSPVRGGSHLLEAALRESNRVANRAIVVADRPIDDLATGHGWQVVTTFDRRVHRSLTRYIHVLSSTQEAKV